MRLIDADNFMEFMGTLKEAGAKHVSFDDLRKFINNQPTAYDVDKVVERLEEAKYEDELYPCNLAVEIEEAERIVKSGGID